MHLKDWPLPYARVSCSRCNREGKMKIDGLLERFGPDQKMHVLREKLTQNGCQRPDKKQPCQSILPDALLVQAILAETKEEIIDPKLIDEAKQWSPRWKKEKSTD